MASMGKDTTSSSTRSSRKDAVSLALASLRLAAGRCLRDVVKRWALPMNLGEREGNNSCSRRIKSL
jgi:hypothetical protein